MDRFGYLVAAPVTMQRASKHHTCAFAPEMEADDIIWHLSDFDISEPISRGSPGESSSASMPSGGTEDTIEILPARIFAAELWAGAVVEQ
jgi:hypothetical protein